MTYQEHDAQHYNAPAQTLHWVIAALIVIQFVLGWSAGDLPLGLHKLVLLARHKSVGMTILMLAVLRLFWRFFNAPPDLPSGMRPIEKRLAQASHMAFYLLLFIMPISGWLMSSAKSYSVSWFGLFTWPNLIPQNEAAFEGLKSCHYYSSEALLVLTLVHVFAALKHHFWDRDDVLWRMLPFIKARKP